MIDIVNIVNRAELTLMKISKKKYDEDEVKVKDHDHITGKYQVSGHQDCNLDLSLSKKISVMFHDSKKCDSLLSFNELETMI